MGYTGLSHTAWMFLLFANPAVGCQIQIKWLIDFIAYLLSCGSVLNGRIFVVFSFTAAIDQVG